MLGERPHQHKCEGKEWGCQVPQSKYWITGSKLKRLQAGLSRKCLRTLDVLSACFANLLCAKYSLTPLGHKTQVWEGCYTLFWGHIFSNVADVEKQVVTSQKETCDQSEAWDGVLIHVSLCPAGRNSVSVWSARERLYRESTRLEASGQQPPTEKCFSGPPWQRLDLWCGCSDVAILKLGTFWHSYFKAVENFWLLKNTSFKLLKKLASINAVWAQGHSEDQHHRENRPEDEAGEEGSIFYLHFLQEKSWKFNGLIFQCHKKPPS